MKTHSIRRAVERSAHSSTRPRLADHLERRFAPGEVRAAACYADNEAMCETLRRLANELHAENDGVVSGELEVTESLAHAAERAYRAARPPTEKP